MSVYNSHELPIGHELLGVDNATSLKTISDHINAVYTLPPYSVYVVSRQTIKEPEITPYAEFNSELVHFSDGAIRELTRATPLTQGHTRKNAELVVSGTDALFTGPKGINKINILGLANLGYNVEWLHHQGRHAELPKDYETAKKVGHFLLGKNLGRSAHHQHALFYHLSILGGISYNDKELLSIGDSRGAMTGEAIDALAPQYDRSVVYSDYIAACFEHRPQIKDIPDLLRILPVESKSLGKIMLNRIVDVVRTRDVSSIAQHLGTVDLHPMNLTHEIAWIWPLMSGDAGQYAKAVPLDAVGTRTLEVKDKMSQHSSWTNEYSKRPGLRIIHRDGTHLDLLREQNDRLERFGRLMQSVKEHDFSLSNISTSTMDKVIYGDNSELVTP